jgi:hypothetical protein
MRGHTGIIFKDMIHYERLVKTCTRLNVAEKNYLTGVLKAFLERKAKRINQNYVVGCFRNVPLAIFDDIAKELAGVGDSERQAELVTIRSRLAEHLSSRVDRTQWSPWAIARS